VPRFYFHQHLNGKLAEDRRGRLFANVKEACEYVVHRTPVVLGKTVRTTGDIYLATQITDGKRTLAIVRAKVIIEET
jgi:hypothetical protein